LNLTAPVNPMSAASRLKQVFTGKPVEHVYGKDTAKQTEDAQVLMAFAINTLASPEREKHIAFLELLSTHKLLNDFYKLGLTECAKFLRCPVDGIPEEPKSNLIIPE
jgi:hypothetical protein